MARDLLEGEREAIPMSVFITIIITVVVTVVVTFVVGALLVGSSRIGPL
jgi:hypothetical protein